MELTRSVKRRKFYDIFGSYLFITPAILGILFFTLIPVGTSLYYSFFEYYSYLPEPTSFVGFGNYIDAFTDNWYKVGNSLSVTFIFTFMSLPINLVLSFSLAMFLNKKIKGIRFFRTLFYLPVLIPAVISGILWNDIANYSRGMLNFIITNYLHLPPYGFFNEPSTVLPSLLFLGFFGLGGGMVLWLAQLKSIPESMYEASKIEGAGFFTNTFKITIPMCTPMIFYNLILGIIGSLQTFAGVYVLRNSLNSEQLNFFVVMIYDEAFVNFSMGDACALSFILFTIIGLITAFIFKTSKWVFYGESM